MFAVTKRGKQKQVKREKEFQKAFAKAEKSTKAYEKTRKDAVKRIAAEQKKRKASKVSPSSRVKQVLDDYQKNPILAMRDYMRVATAVNVLGPTVKVGASYLNKQFQTQRQRYRDSHPTYEY